MVPSPVLNTCLHDMALDGVDDSNPFDESDDEDEKKEKKTNEPTDPFAGSLLFKAGKNQSSHLYYVDYKKMKGLDRDQRERLVSSLATARTEDEAFNNTLKQLLNNAALLLKEPTNEEATTCLDIEEKAVSQMEERLEEARKLKVNEKHKQKTKRRIQNMAAQWRNRKRLCLDFLISLEENTDGNVSAKKCLSGDGQIALDSDEVVAKSAVKYAQGKKCRNSNRGPLKALQQSRLAPKNQDSVSPASLADSNFVAVVLDSQNNVSRVYADEDVSK